MEPDDGLDDDGPVYGWLPPDDRLWRHPSEVGEGFPGNAFVGEPERTARRLRLPEGRVVGIALLSGLTGALIVIGAGLIVGGLPRSTTVVRPLERVSDSTAPAGGSVIGVNGEPNANVIDIAGKVRPAVVQLEIEGDEGKTEASGVVFRSDGEVLTNQHMLDGVHSIVAVLDDGSRVSGRVVGTDPETDIAVIKLEGPSRPVATMGTTAGLKLGQLVVAIGSPLGAAGGPSVTTGVISGLGRTVAPSSGPTLLDMIQTDAPIAAPSSGGALVDHLGNVIGITSAVTLADGVTSLGFAIPIDVARTIAEQLISTGHASHVWLGVEGEDVDDAMAARLGISGGALVQTVLGGSPAAGAGIRITDVITAVDNMAIKGMGDLVVALRSRHVGDKVTITVLHNGQLRQTVTVLTERPANPNS